jgi:hypothetical protein
MCYRIRFLMILVLFSSISHAGLNKTTVHSRANCLNNESITWWRGNSFDWRVVSIHKHISTNETHMIDTGYIFNDRVAAIHWGEGVRGGFVVWGYHYLSTYHKTVPFDKTYAEGCNIIDGWD